MSEQIKIFVPNEGALGAINAVLSRFGVQAMVQPCEEYENIRVECGEKCVQHDLPCRLGGVIDTVLRFDRQSSLSGPKTLSFVGRELDLATLLLSSEGEESVRLTEKEAAVLALLHEQDGRAVSRDDLLKDVWGYAEGLDTHTLETHIYRLRQKIEQDPAKPKILITDDKGYILKL